MISEIPSATPGTTIAEVERVILQHAQRLQTINYIYIISREGKLDGVISIKELFRLPKITRVADVMKKNIISVRPHTDEMRVARLAIEHKLKEIPVVDAENHFEGVVPYDAILKVLSDGHIEDTLRAAGIHGFNAPQEILDNASPFTLFKKRIPWLLVGLGGTAITAAIIGYFEGTLQTQILLASFIPAVTYLSGAVGMQSETLFIRTAALDHGFKFKTYFTKDLRTGLFLAIALSVAMSSLSYIFWQNAAVSLTLLLSLFFGTFISMIIAIALPWSFGKFRVDPAMVGGPLDTIVSDTASVAIYFAIANLIFHWLA
jgi:magnesium transporter